jgi:hypothetical protein
MSSLTTTTINTKDGVTNLTMQTGNSAAARIVLGSSSEGITLGANSSANVIVANSTLINVSVNANMRTINASALNITGSSIGTSGYTRLPNGLLLQWGSVTANSTSGTITFPLTFAAAPYSVSITPQSTGGTNTAIGHAVTAATTTTATVRSTNATSYTYYYWALGV